jgi:RHH-type transcriptional regulator, proline utilization regulon repressor / proline dehydrogenase / delta 1-pyrroline-5-carboxylate dehydrogenase
MPHARLPVELKPKVADTARDLIEILRAKRQQSGVEGLMRGYDLSSQEGVALMCLAEALLRIPDAPTREALIRDKIWSAHLGRDRALFVNAATWGLVIGRHGMRQQRYRGHHTMTRSGL